MFIESSNARKVTQVSMVNPFWLNDIETLGFPSAKSPTLVWHRTSTMKALFMPDTS